MRHLARTISTLGVLSGLLLSGTLAAIGLQWTIDRMTANPAPTTTAAPGAAGWQAPGTWRPWPTNAAPSELAVRLVGPAVILPPGNDPVLAPPADMRITISRRGDGPAEIVVEQSGRQWTVREDRLDDLPLAVQPYVAEALGRSPLNGAGISATAGTSLPPAAAAANAHDIEQRLSELNRQLDALSRAVEELQR